MEFLRSLRNSRNERLIVRSVKSADLAFYVLPHHHLFLSPSQTSLLNTTKTICGLFDQDMGLGNTIRSESPSEGFTLLSHW
jgi:hypothetical protein